MLTLLSNLGNRDFTMDDATATTDEVKKDNIKKSNRTLLM